MAARGRVRRARGRYRHSPEGRKQHHDEEHKRRKRRREERRQQRMGGRDRRCSEEEGGIQVPVTAARPATEKPKRRCIAKRAQVEWILVAWSGLLAAAQNMLNTQRTCPRCQCSGPVVRVVAEADWRRRRVRRGVG